MEKMVLRAEYPNPQRVRSVWQNLNGEWDFKFGDEGDFNRKINVPFAYQTKASGIGDTTDYDVLWYKRKFTLTEEMKKSKCVTLNFLAVDYECEVFVNGKTACTHKGGYGAFSVDITALLVDGEQEIALRVVDTLGRSQPRGKQTWLDHPDRCFYNPTSGIWQSVWLDGSNGDYITDLRITPCCETATAKMEILTNLGACDEVWAEVKTSWGAKRKFYSNVKSNGWHKLVMVFDKNDPVHDGYVWSPEYPNLFHVTVQMKKDGEVLDEVKTYFGFREVYTQGGKFYLNDRPYEQRLVLNQSYWKDYGMTPPSAECFKEDILIAKEMGFNGMRVHQKMDDPWLYYYADTLGFLVWAETPSAYHYDPEMVASITALQTDIVKKVYNNPSVVAYVPLNESWGVKEILNDFRQQSLGKSLYWLIKSLDDTRLVVTNDGWENLGLSDMSTVHDYSKYGDDFEHKYLDWDETILPAGRRLFAFGEEYDGQPFLLSEFGGVALAGDSGWGYGGAETSIESFMDRFERIFANMYKCDFDGWCYTQLTDVEQEVNGLLDADHKPKFDIKKIREVIDRYKKIKF